MRATACAEAGCTGTVDESGYCDTCGTKAGPATVPAAGGAQGPGSNGEDEPTGPVSSLAASTRTAFTSGSRHAAGSRRTTRDPTRTGSSRHAVIGRGIVAVEAAPSVDPASIVKIDPEVAEDKRFCPNCGEPVGRSRGSRPGRLQGFCSACRTPFDFVPKLGPGDLVGRQYEVVGCLAHGGLGWIYLAKDTAVNDRWVVLKGLLNAGDEAAMAAAVAERRFLAEVQHGEIVEVYNFVTHDGAGYTVMEYVGGPSLKQVLKTRMEATDGQPNPLPVQEAIAYVLATLPAFRYLHARGLVYCDFKPDNLLQVGDGVKLIDLGGVRRVDDHTGDIYGTVGFQAPEVPTEGPSFSSDLYTIGRTLLVMTCDFRGYTTTYSETLPDPRDHPALADNEPFWRFVRKACAPHPDDRFQTVDEFEGQLLGVLRILNAVETGTPRPGSSDVFAGPPTAPGQDVPWLAVDPNDPGAAFLTRLSDDPAEALDAMDQATRAGQLPDSPEVRLRYASDLVELGRAAEAHAILAALLEEDPWEWRAVWIHGLAHLASGDLEAAAKAFDRCRSEVPGELAPLYASALVAERGGESALAASLHDLVSTVDPSWTRAALGLARTRTAAGDVDGAMSAYDRVPATHREATAAQIAAVGALVSAGRVEDAAARVASLSLQGDAADRVNLSVLDAALALLEQGGAENPRAVVVGVPLVERDLRRALEDTYRRLARTVDDPVERAVMVDRANGVRRMSLL